MKTKKSLIRTAFAILLLSITLVSSGQKIEGEWTGIVKAPGMDLRMNLYISHDGKAYISTWDSPDQGSFGKQSTKTTFSFPDLYFSYEPSSFEVKAKVDSSYTLLRGEMIQRGNVYSVDLQRKPAAPASGSTAVLNDKTSHGPGKL